MFAYQTKVNEKDALVFNAGSKKEDGEVLALVEKEDGKLDLVNGLLTDDEFLQSVGNIKELIESTDTEIFVHIIAENMEQLEDKVYTNWFINNYAFMYNGKINDSLIFEPTDETTLDITLVFGDTTVVGGLEIQVEPESGDATIIADPFCIEGEQTDISSQIMAYTKNIPAPIS